MAGSRKHGSRRLFWGPGFPEYYQLRSSAAWMAALAADLHEVLIVCVAAVVTAIVGIARNHTNTPVMSTFVIIFVSHK